MPKKKTDDINTETGEAVAKNSAELERKSFTGMELKTDKPGSFTVRIATLNVIDKDGDVTIPGAFPTGKTILISAYQHGSWSGGLPVGKGVIREAGEEVLVDGQFNLATDTGKEHYETVKFAPDLQEWSYGFIVKDYELDAEFNGNSVRRILKSLDVFEASPVLRGAGMNTGTVRIKSGNEGMTYADQSEELLTSFEAWLERSESLTDLRRKQGKVLAISPVNMERVKEIDARFTKFKALLIPPAPIQEQPDRKEVERVVLAYHKLKFKNLEELT